MRFYSNGCARSVPATCRGRKSRKFTILQKIRWKFGGRAERAHKKKTVYNGFITVMRTTRISSLYSVTRMKKKYYSIHVDRNSYIAYVFSVVFVHARTRQKKNGVQYLFFFFLKFIKKNPEKRTSSVLIPISPTLIYTEIRNRKKKHSFYRVCIDVSVFENFSHRLGNLYPGPSI